MAKQFCLYCDEEHDYYEWKYKTWSVDGKDKQGWVCGKHTRVHYPEFIGEAAKEDRKKYFKSALQPYRSGVLSKEYIDAHGTKGIKATQKQIRNAKNVWSDLSGWSQRDKSL